MRQTRLRGLDGFIRGLAALALCAMACGPFRRGPAPEPARIIFRNQSQDQATLYVVSPATTFTRIGVVWAGRTDTLTVASDLTRGTVNIVARLLARTELPQTGPVSIYPGETYEITLPPTLNTLTFLPAR